MAAIEIELPHVLAHGVTPLAPARAEADMIINATVSHDGAGVVVTVARAIIPNVLGMIPGRVLDGTSLGDEMIDLHAIHHVRTEGNWVAQQRIVVAWMDGGAPSG